MSTTCLCNINTSIPQVSFMRNIRPTFEIMSTLDNGFLAISSSLLI